jgi:hypothetical protein
MRVCVWPNIAVVAVENPVPVKQASFVNNTIAGKSGFSVLWCTN